MQSSMPQSDHDDPEHPPIYRRTTSRYTGVSSSSDRADPRAEETFGFLLPPLRPRRILDPLKKPNRHKRAPPQQQPVSLMA